MKIRKNDNVIVIAGKDKGKKGKVRFAHPKDERILVEGVNFIKRHVKATGTVRQAGVIEREEPIHVSKVMLVSISLNPRRSRNRTASKASGKTLE